MWCFSEQIQEKKGKLMGFTDIFKGKQYKSELETLQQKYEDLQSGRLTL